MMPPANLLRAMVVLALCCAAPLGVLQAQVCAGFAELDATRYRVSASTASHPYADELGASLTAGHRLFGTLSGARAYDEELDATAYTVGLEVGADVTDARRLLYLCPVAAISGSIGPRGAPAFTGREYRRLAGELGVGLAGVAWRGRRIAVHPAAGARAVRLWVWERYRGGHHGDDDGYLLLDGGVGLVINDVLTIRPGFSVPVGIRPPTHREAYAVPFGREEREPSFDIAFGFNFGRRTPRTSGR